MPPRRPDEMSLVDVRERVRDSPERARSFCTVRAAISFALLSDAPPSRSDCLMCSYWRARFVPFLTPRGGIPVTSVELSLVVSTGKSREATRQAPKGGEMPGKRAHVKNEKQYEALKDKGMSKERAAKIANSPKASSHSVRLHDLRHGVATELITVGRITARHVADVVGRVYTIRLPARRR